MRWYKTFWSYEAYTLSGDFTLYPKQIQNRKTIRYYGIFGGFGGGDYIDSKLAKIKALSSLPPCKSSIEKPLVMPGFHIKILNMQFKAPRFLNDAVQTN